MPARLNTRLIALVVIALVGAVGVVGAFAALRYRADATRNVRQGDEFMAAGEYGKALSAYGRAVSKEPGNLQFVEKSVGALSKITPTTRNDLRERFGHLQALLEKRVGIAPTKPEPHLDVIQLRLLLAAMGDNSPGAWQRLEEAGQRMADSLDKDDPARLDGELYAAVGAMGRRQLLEPAQFEAAVQRLRAVIAARPSDDLANATLADALIAEGMRRRAANRNDAQAAALLAAGRTALVEAQKNVPNGPLVAEIVLRDILTRREEKDPAVTPEAVSAAAAHLTSTLEQVNDAWVLDRVLAPLLLSGEADAASKASDRLAAIVQRSPDNVVARQVYMLTLSAAGRNQECAEQAALLLAAPPQPVGVAAWLQQEGRVQAATTLFNIDYQSLVTAAPEQREAARAKAEKSLAVLRDLLEQPETDPSFIRSTGRLAAAAGKWTDALGDFEQVIRLVGEQGARPDLLYESAYAAAQAGESGLALRRVSQATASAPKFLDAYILQADLEQRAANLEAARRSVALAKQIAPEDERVLRMERVVELAGGDAVSSVLTIAQQRSERGDVDGARASLADAISKYPGDARLYRAAAFIELVAGQDKQAAELARKGLELAPDDQLLNRALVLSSSRDPVERIVRTVEAEVPEGPDRVARTYAALVRASHVTGRAAAIAEANGAENAAEAKAMLEKLESAVAAQKALADALQPRPALVARVEFEDALDGRRFDEAQAILDRDETSGTSVFGSVERSVLRAQLVLARADSPDTAPTQRRELVASAIRGLEAAIQRNPESTDLHRLLGQSYARLGNLQQALVSLEVAYGQRPTDMGVVEAYAGVLQAVGEQQRLLQVLRTAARQRDVSTNVRAAWLAAESAVGDRRVALAERRTMYQAAPDDLANGVALVGMLLTLPPARELMLDSLGRDRIAPDRWSAMNEQQQRTALDGLRREWLDEASRVLQTLAAKHPSAFEVAVAQADLDRISGRAEAGLAALQAAVAKAGDRATAQMYLTMGAYAESLGRQQEALAAYQESLKRQGPAREADRYLSLRAAERGNFKDAIPHLRAIVGAGAAEERDRLRLAEALGRTGDVDGAEAELKSIIETFGLDSEAAMLDASLAERRLEMAVRSGQTANVPALEQRLRASLRRAQELMPTDPVPIVGEAQAILNAWQRKPARSINDREVDEAIALLDRALAQRADYWPAVRTRVRLFADRGDLTRARSETERLLKLQPTNDEARYALIDLWMRTNATDKAIAVAREGVDLRPFDARMRRTLGDLYDRAGNLPQAIAEHRRSAEIQPTGGTDRLVMLMLKEAPGHAPEHAEIVKFLGARPDEVKRSLYLESALAASLANTGRRAEGLDRLAKAHAEYSATTVERPDLINGWYDMLWLVFPRDRTGEAEAFVRQITAGQPAPFDLRELALRYAETPPAGLEKAVGLLQQAIQAGGALPPAARAILSFDLGNTLYALGRCADAVPVFEEGLSLQPENPGILNNLAFLEADCLDDPAKALQLAQRAVAMAPGEWAFRDTLGDVHAKLGYRDPAQKQHLTAAENEYRAAIAIARNAATHAKLAELMARTGRKSEAKAELRRATEVDPKAAQMREYKAAEAAIGS